MKKNLKDKPLITLTEINIGSSGESLAKLVDSQKDLFHSQVDQLRNIVVTQCRLTGVNPLSQEMAAGALSINIGKRPRDLLNPKGVKYMQSVFSIKDTISKKETREMSAFCGLTATQVREFFAGQRSRVRKLVRLSREKAIKVEAGRMSQGGCPTSSDPAIGRCFTSSDPAIGGCSTSSDPAMVVCSTSSDPAMGVCSTSSDPAMGVCSTSSDPSMRVIDPIPLNVVNPDAIKLDAEKALQGGCSTSSDTAMHVINPTPLNSVDPKAVGEVLPCLPKEETVPGADDFEKKFIENIFNLMRKEETFSGQVKLMEWILQIQNSSVLYWFVTKGGLMMLAAWLNEAALEEQTTALFVIFQVLCHLPLHKALPLQMSAILQSVNRLRFYRTSDISNRAKVLLSRWSKLFVRSQALKKPSIFAAQKEKNFSQSEVLNNEWHSNLDLPDEILSLALDSSENGRKSEPSPSLKLLKASNDDSSKKHIRDVSSTQTKERRKVQLMEHPGRNINGRSLQVPRTMHLNQGRPMSADDIQKAKLRAIFMQSKYEKIGAASSESRQQKTEDLNKSSTSQSKLSSSSKPPVGHKSSTSQSSQLSSPSKPSVGHKSASQSSQLSSPSKPPVGHKSSTPESGQLSSPSKPPVRHIIEESEKSVVLSSENSPAPTEPPMDSKPSLGPEESPLEKLKRNRIPWHLPPEIRMDSEWRVGVGENSKEVEIQTGRIRREKETVYQRIQDIPSNPKEPWDLEMVYDDTLTPQIPIEQAPEEFPTEQAPEEFPTEQAPEEFPTEQVPDAVFTEALLLPRNVETTSVTFTAITEAPISRSGNAPEPDLELLAVLLKNPELVFALTSGQGGMSSADTVKLLDMVKNSGGGLTGILNGLNGNIKEESSSLPSPTPYSFPSPTPSSLPSPTPSERVMNGWRSEVRDNSFSEPVSVTNREAYVFPPAAPSASSPVRVSATGLVQQQSQITNFTPDLAQYLSQTTNFMPPQQNHELWVNSVENYSSGLNHHSLPGAPCPERQLPQMNQNSYQTPSTFNPLQQNILAAAHQNWQLEPTDFGQIPQQPEIVNHEQMQTVKPAPVSIVLNLPDGTPITLPQLMPTQQSPLLPDNSFYQPMHPSPMQWNAGSSSRYNQMSETRGGRQRRHDDSASNPWSQSNQNNYDSFWEEPMNPSAPDRSSWDRNEYMDGQDYETFSPGRTPERSRSPEYRSGRNYSDRRRDNGRNSRLDWSRRRDSGRHDHKQGNRRWRDRRY